jgi:septum formation protein
MWGDRGPCVVEFNARLGDPEAQVLALSDRVDWLNLMAKHAGVNVALDERRRSMQSRAVVGIVLASRGYPYGEKPDVSAELPWNLLNTTSDVQVFCGSVTQGKTGIVTQSGRVFTVSGVGSTFHEARSRAVQRIREIEKVWPACQWRQDIAQTALHAEEAALNSKRKNYSIVLGSSSPRRLELLGQLGVNFEVMRPDVLEKPEENEDARDYVARNAREKGEWIANEISQKKKIGALVISADTIVVLDEKILEKPTDDNHAYEMLSSLQGRTHRVLTGVFIVDVDTQVSSDFIVETEVTLKTLSDRDMWAYIRTGEPFDKAGGYAAQGFGSCMVREIHGSFSNVVGLPLAEVSETLQHDFGVELWIPKNPV